MQPEANARQLQLACNRDARIPRVVMVDPVRLRQVLTNLLGNALKFTDTGRVTLDAEVVALTDRRARLRFAVADTGIGISIDDQARIFERFVQARQAPNRPRGGVGLGLAISARLVSIMGGSLQVASKLGQGSRFWFELDVPVADTSASESTSDSLTTMPAGIRGSHSLRVLVAEDTPASQLLIRDLLSEAGHTVDLASDGAAALDAFRHSAFDLVLMDVQMPRLDGLETTRAMRAHERQRGLPATPIVALTAYALPQHRDECLAAGMTGYLTKPIMASDLFASLHRYRCAVPTPSSASETSSRMDGLEVRWQPSIARLQGRVALFKRLARSFIDHGPMALESLHNAAATHDAAAVRVAAHQLKGQAAMFDAADLCAAARQLEEAATSGHLTNVALVLADVERHHAALIDELRELISA
jgi:CheY-like chemotaxis protein